MIVVGAGVYGITLSLEAARRGLRPLLLERADFGQHTSWNTLRIVHGGLRYLQTLDLHRFRESVGERHWWLRTFPTLVRPLPCLMPLYGTGLRRPAVLRVALRMNDVLSRNRNEGVPPDAHLSDGRVLSPSETVALCPAVPRRGLAGAALWYDAAIPDSQRVLIEMLRWAASLGAVALNYVEVESLRSAGGRVIGVGARDQTDGTALAYDAPIVVNCAGPWAGSLAARLDRDVPTLFQPSVAFNLLLDHAAPFAGAVAVAPPHAGSRTYFLHAWKGRVLAGTFHGPRAPQADAGPSPAEIAAFQADLRAALPDLDLAGAPVLRAHWGLLPVARAGTTDLTTREVIHDHATAGGPRGLFSVMGIKLTTARLVAAKVLRRVLPRVAASGALPAPPPVSVPGAAAFQELLRADPAAASALVDRIVREEAVLHADDVLLRRTDWGVLPATAAPIAAWLRRARVWPAA